MDLLTAPARGQLQAGQRIEADRVGRERLRAAGDRAQGTCSHQ